MTHSLRWCLAAALILLPLWASAQQQSFDRIVALVENDVILQSELDAAIAALEFQAQMSGGRLPARNVLQEQMLERLIMTRLEVLRAEDTGIRVSDSDVDQALEQVAQQNGMTLFQLRSAIEADGIEFREFRNEIRDELLSSRLRQRVVSSMDEVTETEVEILLSSERFGGDEFLLSQIVLTVPETASPSEANQARERARDVVRQLNEGLDFATAALTYSQAPDALDGGDVGWRNINSLPPAFADAVLAAPIGGHTGLVQVATGFVILHVRDRRERSDVIIREFQARHIMVEPTELITSAQARERIFGLRDRIAAGEDFAELARRHSSDEATANIGGLLNWFAADSFGPEIQSVIDSLSPGEVSAPFQTAAGWHMLKLEGVRDADRTNEAVRAEAREMIFRQKADAEVERFLRQMRDESFVEVRL